MCQYSLKPAQLLLIQCLILQSTVVANLELFTQMVNRRILVSCHFVLGLLYLWYPLIGWLADVQFTRYKIVFSSLVVTAISVVTEMVISTGALSYIVVEESISGLKSSVVTFLFILVSCSSVIGLSMFKANAIQFGTDQLLEASSEQLSSFIHWYYWFGELGHFVCGQVVISLFSVFFSQIPRIFIEMVLIPSLFLLLQCWAQCIDCN